MARILFLSRVAFLCNLCMVAAFAGRYVRFIESPLVESTVIIAGFGLSIVFNVLSVSVMLIRIIRRRDIAEAKPAWLFIVNFLCFIFQVFFLVK